MRSAGSLPLLLIVLLEISAQDLILANENSSEASGESFTTEDYTETTLSNINNDPDSYSIEGMEEIPKVPEVPKCCPLGQSLIRLKPDEKAKCAESNLTFNPVFWEPGGFPPPKQVDLLIGERCKDGSYRLEPHRDSQDEFHLLYNGFLHVPYQSDNPISPYDYCLESFVLEDGSKMVLPLICFPPQPPIDPWKEISLVLYPIGCLTSVPFLFATVFIYLLIDELRNLQGKVLSCYSFCLASAYLSLAVVQLKGDSLSNNLCIAIAFVIEFFFVACFFWLNVMCFQLWRKTKNDVLQRRDTVNEKRKFILYSLYGWGFPVLILAVSLIMDLMPTIPPSYVKPNFGIDTCWFQSDNASLSYFYGPISILLSINVVFFILTIKYLHLHTSKDKIIHLTDVTKQLMINRKRQIFIQSLILFCVMGLNWILEVLSWKYGKPPLLWIIIDTFNTLQGVIIFYVFVCRDAEVRFHIYKRWKAFRNPTPIPSECTDPLNSV